ncbi:uncharacterized protein SPSK_07408 [Sporothrix schenckii 1099-18]|uniref:NYN domain-containing protein n=1 Tax=Sporothrix schenckii 1099-18 TaxID=1397361 RepID=A0A0F2MG06_SPOSC|nr:uncharacterized protein SPSK_07408 [Sporothrix schenckii 1099-18]KJR87989.1 hypothetical protein SPSK_07408 [Sporothrix schenckii 1099-18]
MSEPSILLSRPSLDASGGHDVSSPANTRPPSPKLGNFASIFDDWPAGVSSALDQLTATNQGDPVKSLHASEPAVLSTFSGSAVDAPRGSAYNAGFLCGLDFSTIGSPSGTPGSLLPDTTSEDGSGGEDDDRARDVDGVTAGILLPAPADLYAANLNTVLIASPSASPPTGIATVTVKAAAAVADVATPTRPMSILKSPKRTPGPVGTPGSMGYSKAMGQYDLPYPLSSSLLLSSPMAGSPMFSHPIQPLSWHTKQEKLALLEMKLKPEYKRDRALKFPGAEAVSPDAGLLHVFVDLSNIVIGFYNRIKIDRGFTQDKKMTAPPFFFDGLARILERNRPSARLVTTGSAPDYYDRRTWPAYMRQAAALNYEMNILGRVAKLPPSPKLKSSTKHYNSNNHAYNNMGHKKSSSRGHNTGNNLFAESYSSDEGVTANSHSMKIGEQAVDEILQLKMCHSLLDHDPGTIVLATGDAAEAEFSDGFFKHVQRALVLGWCVELLSWKMGISSAWRDLERKEKGTGRFRIIELDRYAEDLLDMCID